MRIVIAGAHGQVARRLGRLLSARGDTVVGIIRNPDHATDLDSDGVRPAVLDLESTTVEELAEVVRGADAVVFAAGAGPGSGEARKHTVDHGAAVLLADAAERAGVRPYLLVSSMGAEDEVLPREALATTILRPGGLTDDPGTGRVTLGHGIGYGSVPRDDVAAVLVALLDARRDGAVVELVSGDTPIAEAVRNVT
jgi:uncharacterized protein YbjT (DUF2867 family)